MLEKNKDSSPSIKMKERKTAQKHEDENNKKTEQLQEYEELTEIEKDMLDLTESIFKMRRYNSDFSGENINVKEQLSQFPILEKLYATAVGRLSYNKGYSKEEIFLAIKSLEREKWIVARERRSRKEILEDEKFQNVISFIKKNPGVHALDARIQEDLGITRTPFLNYAITLQRFKIIRTKKVGKKIHYYLNEVPEMLDRYCALFSKPMVPSIIEMLLTDQFLSNSKIAEEIGTSPSTVQYYINQMKELDILKDVSSKKKGLKLINLELLKEYYSYLEDPNLKNILKGL